MDVQEVGESGQRTRSDDDDDHVSTRDAEDSENSDGDDDKMMTIGSSPKPGGASPSGSS